jgi:hypothetical protein
MFAKIGALFRKKPVETTLPPSPVEVSVKKELVKKATTRKPVAKKATTVAKKTTTKKKK